MHCLLSYFVLLQGHYLGPGILIPSENLFTWTVDCGLDPGCYTMLDGSLVLWQVTLVSSR